MINKLDMSWMRSGVRVFYRPAFLPGGTRGVTYQGTIVGDPFQIGNPKNDRWVVRLEEMDDRFQNEFFRNCVACAGIAYIRPVLPIKNEYPELIEVY